MDHKGRMYLNQIKQLQNVAPNVNMFAGPPQFTPEIWEDAKRFGAKSFKKDGELFSFEFDHISDGYKFKDFLIETYPNQYNGMNITIESSTVSGVQYYYITTHDLYEPELEPGPGPGLELRPKPEPANPLEQFITWLKNIFG